MSDLSEVSIRPIAPTDPEAAARLHIAVWEEAYHGLVPAAILAERRAGYQQRVQRWRQIIASSRASTEVAVHRGELVGFVSVGPARDDDLSDLEELWALYVRAVWWGQGLGYRLFADALGERPAYLWVLDGNDRAIHFYRRQGFAFDGAVQQEREGLHRRMVRLSP